MASGNISIPLANLISGVSQQPETLRIATSAEAMSNCWPSVVSGLNKRPPTEHVAQLSIDPTYLSTGYLIDRDPTYRYIVVATRNDLKVYDLEGNEQPVSFPQGKSYLASAADPSADLRFLTFSDTTFVLNKNVQTIENAYGELGGAPQYTPDGTVPTYNALPTSAGANAVYQTLDDKRYYRRTLHPAGPATLNWLFQNTTTKATGTVVQYLPQPQYAGQQVSTGGGYSFNNYLAVSQAGSAAYYSWTEVSLADLVPQVGDRLNPVNLGTIFVVNSVANINYAVYVDNVLKGNYTTPNGIDANNSVPGTTVIAQKLAAAMIANGMTVTTIGSTICLTGLSPTAVLTVTSSSGDKVMRCYRDTISQFSDLPPNESVGRLVKVKGDVKSSQDDYYVMFDGALWVETYGYNQGSTLLPQTMPHVLVRNADSTWTFQEHTWDDRKAGDRNSNPGPSFLGKPLTDMIVYSGRMVLLSDSNIILSQSGEFENYFRTTIQTLVDDDPIDLEVLSPNVDTLRHVVPFNKDLLLFSDRSQFRFSYTQYVGPKNVQVQYTTSFSCSRDVKPVNMGSSVYFVDDSDTYTFAKVYEYYPKADLAGDDADNLTDPVPQYVPRGVTWIAASPRVKTLLTGYGPRGDLNGGQAQMFVYKFYWNGQTKVQNAWSRWNMTAVNTVLWAGFSLNILYLLTSRDNLVFLEKIRVDEVVDDGRDSRVLLDRLHNPTFTYDPVANVSTITTPFHQPSGDAMQLVAVDADGSRVIDNLVRVSDNQLQTPGDLTGQTLWAGMTYHFEYTFSRPYVRFPRSNGTGELVTIDGRLQMRYMTLEYHQTVYFEATLNYDSHNPVTKVMDATASLNKSFDFDGEVQDTGLFRIPLMGQNTKMSLTLTNSSPFPCAFGGAEWYGLYTPKAKRIG